MSSDERSIRESKLKKDYAEKLGCEIDSLPIQIDRLIQMHSALGEDFDPEKIEEVLEVDIQTDIELSVFWNHIKCDSTKLPLEKRNEWKSIMNKRFIRTNEILGDENFLKVFDLNLKDAIAFWNEIALHKEPSEDVN